MPIVAGIAGLDILFLGLMGVLLLYATRQLWVPFLIWLLQQIPVVGNWVAQHAATLINQAFNWVGARIAQAVHPVTAFFERIDTRLRALSQAVQVSMQATVDAVHHVRFDLLPALERQLFAYVESRVGAAFASAIAAVNAVQHQLAAVDAGLHAALSQAEGAITLAWQTAVAQVRLQFAAALNTLGVYTAAQIQAVADSANRAIAGEAARAQTAEAAVVAEAGREISDAQRAMLERIFGAGGAVAGLEADLSHGLQANLAQSLAGALALVTPLELAIDEIKGLDCIKACNPLGALGTAIEALDLGLIIALLTAAYARPKETADAVRSIAAPLVDEVSGTVQTVLGLKRAA